MDRDLSRGELRRLDAALDRIEERLRSAAPGLHEAGPPAGPRALEQAPLDAADRGLWARWDGLSLGHGDARLFPLAEIEGDTLAARDAGLIRAGDVVVGERGRALLVRSHDPWEDGADIVAVEEDGERAPEASTLPLLVLGLLGEASILFDEDGEWNEGLFGEDGALTSDSERRLLRRRLDVDPDAPLARFRLAQLLRRAGEHRAAVAELEGVLRRAPGFVWCHLELGRALLALDDRPAAERIFEGAVKHAHEAGLAGLCHAMAALASDGEARESHAAAALDAYPGLPAAHEAGAREALEESDLARAHELVDVGLAVAPRHLGLLALARGFESADD
jgi:tetratricopeptide (TPR) repeat protein